MKRRRSHLGCLFWIALILLVLVVFLFNRTRIESVAGALGIGQTKTSPREPLVTRTAPPASTNTTPEASGRSTAAPGGASTGAAATHPSGSTSATTPTSGAQSAPNSGGSGDARRSPHPGTQATTPPSAPAAAVGTQAAAASTGAKVLPATLYFIHVEADGTPVLTPVSRDISYFDSPLGDTLRSLLGELTARELNMGVITLIPQGTKLLDATVREGTAYLNFNDRLRFNSFGADGMKAELQQLVFTATQFPTVDRVQILIGGEVRRFLGPEGIAIDKPLTRASFNQS